MANRSLKTDLTRCSSTHPFRWKSTSTPVGSSKERHAAGRHTHVDTTWEASCPVMVHPQLCLAVPNRRRSHSPCRARCRT
eukprot:293153-Chlamydomonas_euryale.AAC.4